MASHVKLPELGENVEGGTVVEIHVAVGDQITAGQTLFEVEAGKGTVEVPAPVAGKVAEVLVAKGDEIKTGQVLLKVESGESGTSEKEKPTSGQTTAPKSSDGKPPTKRPEEKKEPAATGRTNEKRTT